MLNRKRRVVLLFVTLLSLALLVVCLPGFFRGFSYIEPSESRVITDKLAEHAIAHWEAHCAFPEDMPPTLDAEGLSSCCGGSMCAMTSPPARWAELGLNPKDTLHFSYSGVNTMQGFNLVYEVRAVADLNCASDAQHEIIVRIVGTKEPGDYCAAHRQDAEVLHEFE